MRLGVTEARRFAIWGVAALSSTVGTLSAAELASTAHNRSDGIAVTRRSELSSPIRASQEDLSRIQQGVSSEDPSRRILCLEGSDAELDRASGYPSYDHRTPDQRLAYSVAVPRRFVILSSSDGGGSWRETLRDSSELWMSESSCTFGSQGRVYAAVSATAVQADGHYDSYTSHLHFYRSVDAGQRWSMVNRVLPFVDFTYVLASERGAAGDRIYMFANLIGTGTRDLDSSGHEIWVPWHSYTQAGTPLLISKDDGVNFQPVFPPEDEGPIKRLGNMPMAGAVLADGTPIALYVGGLPMTFASPGLSDTRRDKRVEPASGLSLHYSIDDGGSVQVSRPVPLPRGTTLRSQDEAFAADTTIGAHSRRIYVAYQVARRNQREWWLSTSDDLGQSWRSAELTFGSTRYRLSTDHAGELGFALAVNSAGTVGLAWSAVDSSEV